MTYADIEMAAGTPGDSFDPTLDYEAEAKKHTKKSAVVVDEPADVGGMAIEKMPEKVVEMVEVAAAPAPALEASAPTPAAPPAAEKYKAPDEDVDVEALLADVNK